MFSGPTASQPRRPRGTRRPPYMPESLVPPPQKRFRYDAEAAAPLLLLLNGGKGCDREPDPAGISRGNKTTAAIKYLQRLQAGVAPRLFSEWLDGLRQFEAHQLDLAQTVAMAKRLFAPTKPLLMQLNQFLPQGQHRIFPMDPCFYKTSAAAVPTAAPPTRCSPRKEVAAASAASVAAAAAAVKQQHQSSRKAIGASAGKGSGMAAGAAASAVNAGNVAGEMLGHLTEPGWKTVLEREVQKKYFAELVAKVSSERAAGKTIYPPPPDVFAAFNYTPFADVKVVILGQDPYHGPSQAHGLCFSVQHGVAPPPSLKNMYKELATTVPGFIPPNHGNLEAWARQGVFLLNASLTVRRGEPNSHAKLGWQVFTDAVIDKISREREKVVFMLWGNFAKKKGSRINKMKHAVIESAHPSPLSARFWHGCDVFRKCNKALTRYGKEPIDWQV